MRRVVAVEEGLTPITLLLKRQGYDVVGLEDSRWKDADAVVLSGMDANFLGVEDRMTEANVVTAAGKTPEEVLRDIEHIERKSR